MERILEICDSQLYNYDGVQCDMKSLVNAIALQGDDLIGVELGVWRAESFCTLLQCVPNIKTLYGVDNWQPYIDYIKDPYDGTPTDLSTDREIEYNKFISYHHIKYCANSHKAQILEMDSNEAVDKFGDESIDFIFIDTYYTKEQAERDLDVWYPKVKKGGLFMGHDYDANIIKQVVHEHREKNNVTAPLATYDKCWAWRK